RHFSYHWFISRFFLNSRFPFRFGRSFFCSHLVFPLSQNKCSTYNTIFIKFCEKNIKTYFVFVIPSKSESNLDRSLCSNWIPVFLKMKKRLTIQKEDSLY